MKNTDVICSQTPLTLLRILDLPSPCLMRRCVNGKNEKGKVREDGEMMQLTVVPPLEKLNAVQQVSSEERVSCWVDE